MSPDEAFTADFRRIFGEEFGSLQRYLTRLTGDPPQAEDIAQETFVRLYQRGELPRDPRAWLTAVSNNLVRDEHRRSSRRRSLREANPALVRVDSGLAPDEEHALRERRSRVRLALDGLPLRYRQALLMRHEGYSYREIASALDYRTSGVGKLIVRATEAFRRAYEEGDAPG